MASAAAAPRPATYLAVIPARGGSKGIPGKNGRVVAGRSLLGWSVAHARASERIDRVVVTTDDEALAALARAEGAEVPFLRPAELATDDAPTEPALVHAVEQLAAEGYRPDAVVLLQPTSPLRLPGRIDRAVAQYEAEGADSLVGVTEIHPFTWWTTADGVASSYDPTRRPRRQDLAPDDRRFVENGSIYITATDLLLRSGCRLGGRVALHEMDAVESIDVDDETHLAAVGALLRALPAEEGTAP